MLLCWDGISSKPLFSPFSLQHTTYLSSELPLKYQIAYLGGPIEGGGDLMILKWSYSISVATKVKASTCLAWFGDPLVSSYSGVSSPFNSSGIAVKNLAARLCKVFWDSTRVLLSLSNCYFSVRSSLLTLSSSWVLVSSCCFSLCNSENSFNFLLISSFKL